LPNLRNYPVIVLEGLERTTKDLSRDIRFPGRDSKPGPAEDKAGLPATRPNYAETLRVMSLTVKMFPPPRPLYVERCLAHGCLFLFFPFCLNTENV
jgi:hypothetical protein